MTLDKAFENEVKKVANGNLTREYKFDFMKEIKEVAIALGNRYEFENCIKKYGRVKVALCVAATIKQRAHEFNARQLDWAIEVMLLWTNKNELSVLNAIINIHPAILSDNSSILRKLTIKEIK